MNLESVILLAVENGQINFQNEMLCCTFCSNLRDPLLKNESHYKNDMVMHFDKLGTEIRSIE